LKELILIIGSKGQLGQCLSSQLDKTYYEVIYTSRKEINIANLGATKVKIININPSIVINASAYSDVDKAEENKQAAELINHLAVANIANTCKEVGCWLIHISSDYVFDGNNNQPYREMDITNPKSIYGKSKLEGEYAIQASGCKYLILRTAWLFSEYGNNFMKTMLKLGASHDNLSVVGDQFGCPTYAQDIAKAIVRILDYLPDQNIIGVYHFCGDEQCSWFQFSHEIFKQAKEFGFLIPSNLQSISSKEYPALAARPSYSVLDSNKCFEVFGIEPSDWKLGIVSVLRKL